MINQANKQIKTIQYKCNNVIMREGEGISELATREPGNPAKSEPVYIEILEDCRVLLKVAIKDRKPPLKVNFFKHVPELLTQATGVKKEMSRSQTLGS